jgi:hypothetical protein
MKVVSFASLLASAAVLAACQPVIPQPPAAPAAPSGEWEAAAIPGSRNVSDDIIKLNVATGASWIHCCGSNNNSYFVIKDGTPAPPAGDYHLITWSEAAPNGDVNWNAYRFDRKTGRTWVIENSNGAYTWMEVNTTIAFQ